jgi:hypothetical protein
MGRKRGSSYKQAKETDKDSNNRMRLDIEGTQVRETNRTKGKTNQPSYLLLVQFSSLCIHKGDTLEDYLRFS